MTTPTLGQLEEVGLREIWKSEAGDFTPWLAQEENLRLLGETVGLDLELERQEQEVGAFRADLLCKNTLDDSWVLIENQIERTDHTHLGQILTYAAGLEAVTVIWVAETFTDEHRAALDWLNEITEEKFTFFGLEVELWRIGDSNPAPKFNIVSKPNDWSRTVQKAAGVSGELSAHKQLQRRFWTAFKEHMEAKGSPVRCQKPLAQHWMNHAIGRSGFHLDSIVSLWNSETGVKGPEIRTELYLNGPGAKQQFAVLEGQKAGIEEALGFPLTWHNPENKLACRAFTRRNADFLDDSLWPEQFEWLRQRLEKMYAVLRPIVRDLKVEESD